MFFNAPTLHILNDLQQSNIQTLSGCWHFVLMIPFSARFCSVLLLISFFHTPAEHMNVTRIQAKELKYPGCEFQGTLIWNILLNLGTIQVFLWMYMFSLKINLSLKIQSTIDWFWVKSDYSFINFIIINMVLSLPFLVPSSAVLGVEMYSRGEERKSLQGEPQKWLFSSLLKSARPTPQ